MKHPIFITNSDQRNLLNLMNREKEFGVTGNAALQDLELELKRACIRSSAEIPPDVITMYSKVLLRDLDDGEHITYTLVYPADADLTAEKVSVLAPVGMAILGYREGDILSWAVPAGVVRLQVEKVLYQPEAAGDPKPGQEM